MVVDSEQVTLEWDTIEAIKPHARSKKEKNSHRVHLLIYQMLEMISVFKEQQIVISAIQEKTLSHSQNSSFRQTVKRALTVNSHYPFPHPALQCTWSILYVLYVILEMVFVFSRFKMKRWHVVFFMHKLLSLLLLSFPGVTEEDWKVYSRGKTGLMACAIMACKNKHVRTK